MRPFVVGERFAAELDAEEPVAAARRRFRVPHDAEGELTYLCGHSLGPMPVGTVESMAEELDCWASLAVEGHFRAERPWWKYDELFSELLSPLLGCKSVEVVVMNSLTVNLHLLLASFYRPRGLRNKILIETSLFHSDRYAIESHLRVRGYEPDDIIVVVNAPLGDATTAEIVSRIQDLGETLALVYLEGVSYLSGRALDIGYIAESAHKAGSRLGLDLAHAVGSVALSLHDWQVDFGVFCTYKYLNAGPGAVGGCFVHERHGEDQLRPRLAGWWGTEPTRRFDTAGEFRAQRGAAGWQLSNPPILSMTPLLASLGEFARFGMPNLCERSHRLLAYCRFLLDTLKLTSSSVITPSELGTYGCHISLRMEAASEVARALRSRRVVVDHRPPGILRAAFAPLYNTYTDAWRFVSELGAIVDRRSAMLKDSQC